jgi:LacI family transcriptional regulator
MSPALRPTAVFCANDLLTLGLLQQMTGHGIAVPGEVAIVGYDDIEFAAAAAVPLHRQVVFQAELEARRSSLTGTA